MRKLKLLGVAAVLGAAAASPIAWAAEDTFDACEVFTQAEAEKALGAPAAAPAEPVNPKTKLPPKRPKVIPICTYSGFKESKPVSARAEFRFGKTEGDAQKAFDDARMLHQTKPLLITGADSAFWSGKTGQLYVRKGRTLLTLQVGPAPVNERDMNDARKLGEILAKKL
jgi:hypothetical protein